MVVNQVKPVLSHHDRNRPDAEIIVEFLWVLAELLANAPGAHGDLGFADHKLRGGEVLHPALASAGHHGNSESYKCWVIVCVLPLGEQRALFLVMSPPAMCLSFGCR